MPVGVVGVGNKFVALGCGTWGSNISLDGVKLQASVAVMDVSARQLRILEEVATCMENASAGSCAFEEQESLNLQPF